MRGNFRSQSYVILQIPPKSRHSQATAKNCKERDDSKEEDLGLLQKTSAYFEAIGKLEMNA